LNPIQQEEKQMENSTVTAVRAKMRLESAVPDGNGTNVRLSAVYSLDPASENAQFSKYTPSASLQMLISAGRAAELFAGGGEFYVDITRAGAPA
jgi:hypothetical protein